MTKKLNFIFFIFVLIAGTTDVDLTASEEQELSDKIYSMTINSDGTRAVIRYGKPLETEKFGISHREIIRTLKTVHPLCQLMMNQ